jgi:hypothetical protein
MRQRAKYWIEGRRDERRALEGTEGHRGDRAEEETEGSREDRGLLRKQRVIERIEVVEATEHCRSRRGP